MPDSFGYWKVVDCDGVALITALGEPCAIRWAKRTDIQRRHNGRLYFTEYQEGRP